MKPSGNPERKKNTRNDNHLSKHKGFFTFFIALRKIIEPFKKEKKKLTTYYEVIKL